MAEEDDFIINFYFNSQKMERDVPRITNMLANLASGLRELGYDAKYLDQAANAMAKFAGASDKADASSRKLTASEKAQASAAERVERSQNLVQQAASGNTAAYEQLSKAQGQAIEMNKRFDEQNKKGIEGLRSVGYELIVTGGILTRFGQAGVQGLAGIIGTAIDYERAFANVIRTTNDGSISMSRLRGELVGLTEDIPVAFANLAEIATLGGQLGIAGAGIEDFTSVVARLTATTDLTAEAAGTALGRFQALLGVPSEEFENLASAILKVGVNSVATETQIVAISTQISSMADFAGFTADQVVGLAGALASVGAQPELSRGTVTRTFSLISKAVAEGGEKLDEFARISGVSSAQFAADFGTSRFASTFQSFLANLGQMQDRGENALATLNGLGISSVRDVPLLLRLAGATDTVTRAFNDANTGYSEATTLQEQYGIVAETTAARIQILVNNVMALFDALGSTATGPISDFVDGLSEVVKSISTFLQTDAGQRLGLIVLAVIGVVSALTVLAGGAAFTAGTFLLLTNAADTLGISFLSSTAAATRLNVALTALKSSFTAIGAAITIALLTPQFAQWASDAVDGLSKVDEGVEATAKRIKESFSTDVFSRAFNEQLDPTKLLIGAVAPGIGTFVDTRAIQDIKNYDKALTELVSYAPAEAKRKLDDLREAFRASGGSQEEFNSKFPSTIAALKTVSAETFKASQEQLALADATRTAEEAQEKLATQLGLTPDALTELQGSIKTGFGGFVQFGDLIQRVQDQTRGFAEATSKEVYGSIDSWQQFYDGSSVDIHAFMDLLDQQIDNQATWAEDIGILTARGATSFVTELAKMGPEGAPLAAAAVNLVGDELARLEEQARLAAFLASDAFAQEFTASTPKLIEAYRNGGIEAVRELIATSVRGASEASAAGSEEFARNPILVQIQDKAAQDRLDAFYKTAEARSINIPVDVYVRNATGGVELNGNYVRLGQIAQANGGLIRGPGTGTSDSIPARLSNNEYVIRAASVRKYGTGLFDSLNRGVARFANGGPVGMSLSRSAPNPSGAMSVVELGQYERTLLLDIARRVGITISGSQIATATSRSAIINEKRGSN